MGWGITGEAVVAERSGKYPRSGLHKCFPPSVSPQANEKGLPCDNPLIFLASPGGFEPPLPA
jgi:hypothetical protein